MLYRYQYIYMRLTQHEDVGFMVSSVRNGMILKLLPVIFHRQSLLPQLPARKTLKRGHVYPIWKTKSQQRNVVLHTGICRWKICFLYPSTDVFINAGSGGGIGWH